MCISREHFNLCKCGCPESVHEEPSVSDLWLSHEYNLSAPSRGKCNGEIPLDLSGEEIMKLIDEAKARGDEKVAFTRPCDCQKFEPLFKPMCTGFGG